MQCTNAVLVSAETVYPLVLAKLDGTEYGIADPGLNSSAHSKIIDRRLNFTPRNTESPTVDSTVYNIVYIDPCDIYGNIFDLSGADVITFTATVGDNGAWED